MNLAEAYNELMEHSKEVIMLNNIRSILYWDFETYIPSKSVQQRSEQFGYLATKIHEKTTCSRIGELLKLIKEDSAYDSLNEIEKRNVYLVERESTREIKVPADLVAEIAKQSTIAVQAWKKAKAKAPTNNNAYHEIFKPELDKILNLSVKRANYLDPDKSPFDVLLDEYEPGMTSEMVDVLFKELKEGLIPLIKKCMNSPNQPDKSILSRKIPIIIQEKLAIEAAKEVFYDLERGRIDTTEHPFTTGFYDDVRITTHFYETDFTNSLYSVMHEGGHGIYNQNMPKEYIYQPVGTYCSLGFHESQSRWMENLIGRSHEFWEHFFPKFKEITGDIFSDVSLESMLHAVNVVEPSKIRVTSDEVTYCLHVIIRFEVEQELLSGKITTEELPQIWNQKYKEYLGVDIEHDAEGVMQDTHWAGGGFGYFPTYALGNMYSAQMQATMKKELSDYKELIRTGNSKPIFDWLVKNVHRYGNRYDPPALIKKITREELSPKYFLNYLEEKYSSLYGF
ncbi:MAG: carboxypeptidase M32 [Candidatus Heimdallarchaeota archaeon]|nr:carboxypeptidase M32 [Candidatus Heimdallarchaeota archaeon]